MTEADFALMERATGVEQRETRDTEPSFDRPRARATVGSEATAGLVEISEKTEQEPYPLSKSALRLLDGFVTDKNLSEILLTPEDAQQLAAGIIRLRGPMLRTGASLDYLRIAETILSPGGTARRVAEEAMGGSEPSRAHNALKALGQKCEKAAPKGVKLATLFELGDPEYEPQITQQAAKALGGTAALSIAIQPHAVPSAPYRGPVMISGPVIQRREEEYPPDVPLAWQADSLCAQVDPEAFFPEKGGSTRSAKKICTDCETRDICLRYAMNNDERFGIWGGLSERERRKLKKQPNAA